MIEYLPLVLTGLGLTASIVYYANVLRNQTKTQKHQLETRQAQFYLHFYEKWDIEYINAHVEILEKWEWETYEEFMEKYGPDTTNWMRLMMVISPYENMGILVDGGLVDPKFIWQWTSNMSLYLWEKIESVMVEYRKQTGGDMFLWWTEVLYYYLRDEREKDRQDHAVRVKRMEKLRRERGDRRAISMYGFDETHK